jgi:outer membrane protein TolC
LKSDLKRAQLAYEQSSKSLKREELNLIYSVSNSYYTLLSSQKSAEIALSDLERQKEAFEISQNKYKAGLIKEVDALQMEVDLAEAQNSYDIAVQNQTASVNSLKEGLGVNLQDSITLSSDLRYEPVAVNADQAVEFALKNRLEIREQEIQIEQQKLTIQQQKSAGKIQSKIDAYIGKLGVDDAKRTTYSDAFQNSYGDYINRPFTYGIGFTVNIPIFDWGENKALVRASEARLKQYGFSKEETQRSIETEVRNLVASLNSNLKRLQLLEKNLVVAEKSFEITRQRYSDGDIDSQALALERNRLNTAYRNHLGAYINYQLSLADLMRKTFYDFRQRTPIE